MGAEGETKAPTVFIETVLVVRPIKIIGLLCGVLAVLLLMLSVAATAWLRADRIREGLWERCEYNATNSDWMDCGLRFPREWATACQALCLISLIVCIIAIVVTSVGLRTTNFQIKYKLYWGRALSLLYCSGISAHFSCHLSNQFLDEEIQNREQAHWSFGWAYIVGWGGASE